MSDRPRRLSWDNTYGASLLKLGLKRIAMADALPFDDIVKNAIATQTMTMPDGSAVRVRRADGGVDRVEARTPVVTAGPAPKEEVSKKKEPDIVFCVEVHDPTAASGYINGFLVIKINTDHTYAINKYIPYPTGWTQFQDYRDRRDQFNTGNPAYRTDNKYLLSAAGEPLFVIKSGVKYSPLNPAPPTGSLLFSDVLQEDLGTYSEDYERHIVSVNMRRTLTPTLRSPGFSDKPVSIPSPAIYLQFDEIYAVEELEVPPYWMRYYSSDYSNTGSYVVEDLYFGTGHASSRDMNQYAAISHSFADTYHRKYKEDSWGGNYELLEYTYTSTVGPFGMYFMGEQFEIASPIGDFYPEVHTSKVYQRKDGTANAMWAFAVNFVGYVVETGASTSLWATSYGHAMKSGATVSYRYFTVQTQLDLSGEYGSYPAYNRFTHNGNEYIGVGSCFLCEREEI